MPELPEAECVASCLRERVLSSTILSIWVGRVDIIRHGSRSLHQYIGAKIVAVERKGKCVVFVVDHPGGARYIVAELGMTGLLLFRDTVQVFPQHTHLILKLNGLEKEVRYWNARRFGRMHFYDSTGIERFLSARYGPDALQISFEDFSAICRTRKGRLKRVLMNQKIIAGIGNIYANEILFDAQLHPHREVSTLRPREYKNLFSAIRRILNNAITLGGSSIQNFKLPDGTSGGFQARHAVYHREGLDCISGCGSTIQRFLEERSSFVCVKCQR